MVTLDDPAHGRRAWSSRWCSSPGWRTSVFPHLRGGERPWSCCRRNVGWPTWGSPAPSGACTSPGPRPGPGGAWPEYHRQSRFLTRSPAHSSSGAATRSAATRARRRAAGPAPRGAAGQATGGCPPVPRETRSPTTPTAWARSVSACRVPATTPRRRSILWRRVRRQAPGACATRRSRSSDAERADVRCARCPPLAGPGLPQYRSVLWVAVRAGCHAFAFGGNHGRYPGRHRQARPRRVATAGAKVVAAGAAGRRGGGHLHRACTRRPEQIVAAAIQEDADAIGLSIPSGAHMTQFARVLELLKRARSHRHRRVRRRHRPRRRHRRAGADGRGEDLHPGRPTRTRSHDWVEVHASAVARRVRPGRPHADRSEEVASTAAGAAPAACTV